MKDNLIQRFKLLEFWILENVFQRFCDFSHNHWKLTNFFWAWATLVVSILAMLNLGYKGFFVEKDPMLIFPLVMIFVIYLPATLYSVRRFRFRAYEEAMIGNQNSLKTRDSDLRANALFVVVVIIAAWTLISIKTRTCHIDTLIVWITMSQYPLYSFCSCTPPMRRPADPEQPTPNTSDKPKPRLQP